MKAVVLLLVGLLLVDTGCLVAGIPGKSVGGRGWLYNLKPFYVVGATRCSEVLCSLIFSHKPCFYTGS